MPDFNDLNLKNWKESKIITDTFWYFPRREKKGKHSNFYHGNFIPQIVRQFILRYTKRNETIFDPFLGGGTTAYEAENLQRNCIGIDLKQDLIKTIQEKITTQENFFELLSDDSTQKETYQKVNKILEKHKQKKVQLVILHPPYWNLIRFSDNKKDLSNIQTMNEFFNKFSDVVKYSKELLEKNRYLAIVIMDMFKDDKFYPLGFHCMTTAIKQGLELRGIIVKSMKNSRGSIKYGASWRYKALESDHFVSNHEYIFIFKNN